MIKKSTFLLYTLLSVMPIATAAPACNPRMGECIIPFNTWTALPSPLSWAPRCELVIKCKIGAVV